MTIDVLRFAPASHGRGDASRRTTWTWMRTLAGGAILVLVIWRLGAGPFVEGPGSVDAPSLVAATALTALTTACSAWRWCVVAAGQGVGLPLRTAVAAYYRSQFLNTILPGGVLGDVHRGVSHGRDVDDVRRGLRAVGWERCAGQVVQIVLTGLVLLVLPSPVRSSMPVVLTTAALVVLGVVLAGLRLCRPGGPGRGRVLRAMGSDLHRGLLSRHAWPRIVLASVVVVAGHAVIFLIAARTAGSTAAPIRMLPIALLVLLASAVPTNIGGWGPREGVGAWAFGMAGLGATQGVAATVTFGVMVLVATLPGAVVVSVGRLHGGEPRCRATPRPGGVVRG